MTINNLEWRCEHFSDKNIPYYRMNLNEESYIEFNKSSLQKVENITNEINKILKTKKYCFFENSITSANLNLTVKSCPLIGQFEEKRMPVQIATALLISKFSAKSLFSLMTSPLGYNIIDPVTFFFTI